MSFTSSKDLLAAAGIKAKQADFKKFKKFGYLKKSDNSYFSFRIVPDLDGYAAMPVSYHQNIFSHDITSESGEVSKTFLKTNCTNGDDCPICDAAKAQQRAWGKNKPDKHYLVSKEKRVSFFVLVYEVVTRPNQKPFLKNEKEPIIVELRPDEYDNLATAVAGVYANWVEGQPTFDSPEGGIVFTADRKSEPSARGNAKQTFHFSATDLRVAAPADWESSLRERAPLEKHFTILSHEDMAIIVGTDAEISEMKAYASSVKTDPEMTDESKVSELKQVEEAMKETIKKLAAVTSPDFASLYTYWTKRKVGGAGADDPANTAAAPKTYAFSRPNTPSILRVVESAPAPAPAPAQAEVTQVLAATQAAQDVAPAAQGMTQQAEAVVQAPAPAPAPAQAEVTPVITSSAPVASTAITDFRARLLKNKANA